MPALTRNQVPATAVRIASLASRNRLSPASSETATLPSTIAAKNADSALIRRVRINPTAVGSAETTAETSSAR